MLKRACTEIWEGVVELAEGRDNPDAREHVTQCGACSQRLEELRQVLAATAVEFHDAPDELIHRVLGLIPSGRTVRARLLRSTLAALGSRSEAEDFQLVVGADEVQTRLMYVHEESGWEVVGRTPGSGWSVSAQGVPVEVDEDGRFSFHVPALRESALVLTSGTMSIEIASAEELLSDGANGPR